MLSEQAILDACCNLNLYATGEMGSILEVLPYGFVIGTRARAETQWLKTEQPGEREEVDLAPLLDAGLLIEQSLEGSEETALFVELGAHMEDGEAEAAALAAQRGYTLATDERKVRRVLAERRPDLKVIGTVDLLYEWQMRSGMSDEDLSGVLKLVTFRASLCAEAFGSPTRVVVAAYPDVASGSVEG